MQKRGERQATRGQTLLEVLFALALFVAIAIGMLTLSARYLNTLQRSADISTASFIMQESFEAVQSIAYSSWESVSDGDHGLAQVSSQWQFSGTSDVVNGRFTRTVTVSPVQRNNYCDIVNSGGFDDPDTKMITVTIEWQVKGQSYQRFASKYYTNWHNPTPLCTATESGSLVIHVEDAQFDSTKKQMEGVTFENDGLITVTIDKLKVSWLRSTGGSSGSMTSIKINGSDHWHSSNGVGSPSGTQSSGATIDIVDVTIPPGTTVPVDRFRFVDKLDGSQFTVTAIMGDTSSTEVSTDGFLP